MMRKPSEDKYIGKKFGKLTVIEMVGVVQNEPRYYCKCDCGGEITTRKDSLRKGDCKSCGCLKLEYQNKRAQDKQKRLAEKKANQKPRVYTPKTNVFDLSGEYGIGYTDKNEPFYFDLDDYDKIKDLHWRTNDTGYIIANISKSKKQIYMHRLVMGLGDYSVDRILVDHIHHVVYDNRKSQLRLATNQENQRNRVPGCNNTKGDIGVYYYKNTGKWTAQICINGKTKYIGCYDLKQDAVKARKEAEEKYFGEFKCVDY